MGLEQRLADLQKEHTETGKQVAAHGATLKAYVRSTETGIKEVRGWVIAIIVYVLLASLAACGWLAKLSFTQAATIKTLEQAAHDARHGGPDE